MFKTIKSLLSHLILGHKLLEKRIPDKFSMMVSKDENLKPKNSTSNQNPLTKYLTSSNSPSLKTVTPRKRTSSSSSSSILTPKKSTSSQSVTSNQLCSSNSKREAISDKFACHICHVSPKSKCICFKKFHIPLK